MNEITTKENTDMVMTDSWGAEGASNQDVLIPRLQLMQDISDSVKKRKHDAGDIIDSTTGEVLVKEGEGLVIIPFMTFREWLVFNVDDKGKEKYREKILITIENQNLPKEDMIDGTPIRRYRGLNYFCMLPGKLDALPFLVSFKKTSFFPGKQLSTHFQICAMKCVPPAAKAFVLSSEERSWEEYTFKVFNIEPARDSSEEELAACKKWYQTLRVKEAHIADEYEDDFNPENLEV